MNYVVVWVNKALDQLADYWLTIDPPTRARMEIQLDVLNTDLAANPNQLGESRASDVRIVFDSPIGILIRVKEPDKVVYVTHFWTY